MHKLDGSWQGFEWINCMYASASMLSFLKKTDKEEETLLVVINFANVAQDFKRIYGRIPKKFALSVIGNSQYTHSNTVAEIDFIEFLPEGK